MSKQYHCGVKRESGLTVGRRRIRPSLVVQCRMLIPASIHTAAIEMTQPVVFICVCTHMCLCVYVFMCVSLCVCVKNIITEKSAGELRELGRGSRDGSREEREEMGGGI